MPQATATASLEPCSAMLLARGGFKETAMWFLYLDWKAVRLHLRTCTVIILALVGAQEIFEGWRMMDLSKLGVIVEPGYIRIDGGIGELGMGILVLYGAWFLFRRWFTPA
jgi:hypothetical protein